MKRTTRDLRKVAAEFGREIEPTGSGHYKLSRPGAQPVYTGSNSIRLAQRPGTEDAAAACRAWGHSGTHGRA